LSEQHSPVFNCGRVAKSAALSAAAVGASDEPADAVGNAGRTSDSALPQGKHVFQGRDTADT